MRVHSLFAKFPPDRRGARHASPAPFCRTAWRTGGGGRAQGRPAPAGGFTVIELMMVLTIILLIFVGAFSMFDGSTLSGDVTQNVADANENVRAAMTFMMRDFSVSGAEITVGGIAVPAAFLPGRVLYPVMPFYEQGPTVNGQLTDHVMIVYNQMALEGLDSEQSARAYQVNGPNAIDPAGGSVVLNTSGSNPTAITLSAGDVLLVKTNTTSTTALGYVTGTGGTTTVNFAAGDPLQLNQVDPAASPLGALSCRRTQPSGCVDQAVAIKVSIVQYYIDDRGPNPVLMRQVNGADPTQLGLNIENLKITYSLSDNTTSPDPAAPANIRQANIFLLGRSGRKAAQDQTYYRIPLRCQVATRNLAYAAAAGG